ncbi:hypothetical protein M2145_002038 [Lachnospiraceae bacterium PF1-21]
MILNFGVIIIGAFALIFLFYKVKQSTTSIKRAKAKGECY